MGARGPKKGFKLARLEGAGTPLSAIEAPAPEKPAKMAPLAESSAPTAPTAADLENYRGNRARTGRVLQGSLRSVAGFAD